MDTGGHTRFYAKLKPQRKGKNVPRPEARTLFPSFTRNAEIIGFEHTCFLSPLT